MKVRLVGTLTRLAGRPEIQLKIGKKNLTVAEAIRRLCNQVSNREFNQAIIDPNSGSVGSHIIVLVNDREIGILQGLETRIRTNDAVTLIPVSHGG